MGDFMSSVKDRFIRELVDELNEVNQERLNYSKSPLDICFMTSVLDQRLEDCTDFIKILESKRWLINGYDCDEEDYYTNGRVRILIEKSEEEKKSEYMVDAYEDYYYYIEFLYDERHWGYCFCDESTEGYSQKHKCAGYSCDWTAPAFRITKEIDLHYGDWKGYEKDYWNYSEKFEQNEKNINAEVEKHKIEQEKKFLSERIAELQSELANLEN